MDIVTSYQKFLGEFLDMICFEKNGRRSFSLEELFYPVKIDEGEVAFQSYADQMSRAYQLDKIEEVQSRPEQEAMKRRLLQNLELRRSKEDTSAEDSRRSDRSKKIDSVEMDPQNSDEQEEQEHSLSADEGKTGQHKTTEDKKAMDASIRKKSQDTSDNVRARRLYRTNGSAKDEELWYRKLHDEVTLAGLEDIFQQDDIKLRLCHAKAVRERKEREASNQLTVEIFDADEDMPSMQERITDTIREIKNKRTRSAVPPVPTEPAEPKNNTASAPPAAGLATVPVTSNLTQEKVDSIPPQWMQESGNEVIDTANTESDVKDSYDQTVTEENDKLSENVSSPLPEKNDSLNPSKELRRGPDNRSRALSTLMRGQDTHRQTENTVLEKETQYSRQSLYVLEQSRILVMASAGHGKTTLLKRVALWYCHNGSSKKEHSDFQRQYSLNGSHIPCLIYLRDIAEKEYAERDVDLKDIINYAMFDVLKRSGTFQEKDRTEAEDWVDEVREKLILLIDGLDELSDTFRGRFLAAVQQYLQDYPDTPVIMTSRAAGLLGKKTISLLLKMNFRGRSIVPLTDTTASLYSKLWIQKTQPPEQQASLVKLVDQILTQSRFYYLREFLRTPLELFLILKQVSSGKLSLNRFQMFHDTLWEYFTNHVTQYNQKRFVFEDTMTFLSFLAYQMQIKDSLYISLKEINQMRDTWQSLSFYTDYIREDDPNCCGERLEELASSVGIVEKGIRQEGVLLDNGDIQYEEVIVYTFPIRAYQEYLTAYACCHLCLTDDDMFPDPKKILSAHLKDSRWLEIINFALYDLEDSGSERSEEFNSLTQLVFSTGQDMEQLKAILEGNLSVSGENAAVLCRHIFSNMWLTQEQREVLSVCMGTDSAASYVDALRVCYREGFADNVCLGAYALALIIWECSVGDSPWKKAVECLRSDLPRMVRTGVMMVLQMAKALLKEILPAQESFIRETFSLSESLVPLLVKEARSSGDWLCAAALVTLMMADKEQSDCLSEACRLPEIEQIMLAEMHRQEPLFRRLVIERKTDGREPDVRTAVELVSALGSLPLRPSDYSIRSITDPFTLGYCHFLYDTYGPRQNMDRIAFAKALLYGDWDWDRFTAAWTEDICEGMPSRFQRKKLVRPRDKQHFMLVRSVLEKQEEVYLARYTSGLNDFSLVEPDSYTFADLNIIPAYTTVISLFNRGTLREAAIFCAETMGDETSSTPNNLAFLMRFGHLTPQELGTDKVYHIETLLLPPVWFKKEPVATVNLALYVLEKGQYERADRLFRQLTPKDWETVTKQFWLPDLWKQRNHPEGALVCVLAMHYGGLTFEDKKAMRQSVRHHYPHIYTAWHLAK